MLSGQGAGAQLWADRVLVATDGGLDEVAPAVSGCSLPLVALIRANVLGAVRIHGDDTTVPVLTKGKTITGRLWTYVCDDRPFGRWARRAAVFYYSRDRGGEHPRQHLAD